MKNKLYTILFALLIFGISYSFAQTIECKEIEFSFYPNIEQEDEAGFKVKLLLEASNLGNDTITLKTNVKMSLLGPKNIKAHLVTEEGKLRPLESWIDNQMSMEQSEEFQLIRVLTPNKREASLVVTYNLIGSTIMKYQPDSEDFYACQQKHEYFYPMNVPIREVKISVPDSIKYFASYEKENNEIKDINLSFINKRNYNQESITKGNLNINLHIPDSLMYDKRMRQNIIDFQRYTNKLSTYLTSSQSADIIYINWRDDKARRAFGEALTNHAVCDINFSSKDLLHELIHILLPVNVEESSKGEYFMKESIIEWLALFLSEKTIDRGISNPVDSINLYDAKINNHTTWGLIYRTGPWIIQQMASKYGEDMMAEIIISFLNTNRNTMINYDKFIAYMKKHLSDDSGEGLDYLVKTSYYQR